MATLSLVGYASVLPTSFSDCFANVYIIVYIYKMNVKSKVISARIPVDVAEMFENSCTANGLTVSDGLKNMILKPSTDVLVVNDVPDELSMLLAGIGGLAVGTIVYETLNRHLPNDGRINPDAREILCFIGAVATAGAAVYGLNKLAKK